ncbi:hypothetical protein ACHQM5_021205 [Ranunculus cassubicifolius]
MNMRIFFNNKRITTFLTNSMQSFSFSHNINLIANPIIAIIILIHHQRRLRLGRITAAQQNYHQRQEQTKMP